MLRSTRSGERYETGFRAEWRHVHEVVTAGARPLTPAADAAADVALVRRMVSAATGRPPTRPDAAGVALLGAGLIAAIHA